MGRAQLGRVRAAVKPEVKREAEAITRQDFRLRSLSQLVEAALGYFIRDYRAANGNIDKDGFPVLPPKDGGPPSVREHHERRIASRP